MSGSNSRSETLNGDSDRDDPLFLSLDDDDGGLLLLSLPLLSSLLLSFLVCSRAAVKGSNSFVLWRGENAAWTIFLGDFGDLGDSRGL